MYFTLEILVKYVTFTAPSQSRYPCHTLSLSLSLSLTIFSPQPSPLWYLFPTVPPINGSTFFSNTQRGSFSKIEEDGRNSASFCDLLRLYQHRNHSTFNTSTTQLIVCHKKILFDLQFEGSFVIWVLGRFGFIDIFGFFSCKSVLRQIWFFSKLIWFWVWFMIDSWLCFLLKF